MRTNVPVWIYALVGITVVILAGESYLIFAAPLPTGPLGAQLVELAGRNIAMLAVSLSAIITGRRSWFMILCIMGLVRESWDRAIKLF